jgi:hypothetical protein
MKQVREDRNHGKAQHGESCIPMLIDRSRDSPGNEIIETAAGM